MLCLKPQNWDRTILLGYQRQMGSWVTYLGLGYWMPGLERAMELWLLGFGKWQEAVVNSVLRTASYCFDSMRTITGIKPRFSEIYIKNETKCPAAWSTRGRVARSPAQLWFKMSCCYTIFLLSVGDGHSGGVKTGTPWSHFEHLCPEL